MVKQLTLVFDHQSSADQWAELMRHHLQSVIAMAGQRSSTLVTPGI